ncbi:hypothetical protein FUA23_15355 [Neolewinella aurantiaca]|uniref:Uncharacterized protein n=1 Tax=Neolewinella aurantiaca TaxID=2602767 RepID=A0A5C7FFJ3_9BACT|nr:hypothetical protein [Neolewinella aurantiaca]TXF88355.1 hypothetical protein FUA23_15355 [Neolewinella aurantiaca]
MKRRHFRNLQWCLAVALTLFSGGISVMAQAGGDAIISGSADLDDDYLYFDLACNAGPFSGYFEPERWDRPEDNAYEMSSAIEGKDRAGRTIEMTGIVFSAPRSVPETWSIEVPASGYLSFRIRPQPQEDSSPDFIQINGENTNYQVRSDGLYYSPFLQKGDRFSLRIPAGDELFHWSELVFHTNFSAVIVRPEASTVALRYVPIETGKIQRVFFPADEPGTWPLFDQDGDRTTTIDQVELRSSTDVFDVEYVDNEVVKDGEYVLQRTFTIREKCRRANRMQLRRDWSRLPLIVTTECQK